MADEQLRASFPLRLPKSLYQKAKEYAAEEGISVNFLLTLALADYLARRSNPAGEAKKKEASTDGIGYDPRNRLNGAD